MNQLSRAKVVVAAQGKAAIVTFLPDIRWACGFTGSNAALVILPDGVHFISDGRYREQAAREVEGATIHIPGYNLFKYIAEADLLAGCPEVLFQADHVTVAELGRWKALMPSVVWCGVEQLFTKQVASKTAEEVSRIRRAQGITDAVFEVMLGVLRPGITEQDVAAEIVYQHLQRGASRMSFDPIVASGPLGALPHARPTSKRLESGDLVVLDFGCVVDGYASDMTRTVALGPPSDEARVVYDVVLDAQRRAIEQARAGMSSKALDEVARRSIREAGYGDYFTHGLGHGIGLQTHEWPRLSYHVDHILPEGAVVTIEPGVYIPDQFGVRIEDIIVLHADGCDTLTGSPKELTIL